MPKLGAIKKTPCYFQYNAGQSDPVEWGPGVEYHPYLFCKRYHKTPLSFHILSSQ